jgi:hypothetical protein
MGAKEFSRKHCDRECVNVVLGSYYNMHSMSCKVTRKEFEGNPDKYQWLKTIGKWNWTNTKFAFNSRTSSFINWQALKVMINIDKVESDWAPFDDKVRDVIQKSIKEVYNQCAAVDGKFVR